MSIYEPIQNVYGNVELLFSIDTHYISQVQQRERRKEQSENKNWVKTIEPFWKSRLSKGGGAFKGDGSKSHNTFLILLRSDKHCTLYDICQQKAILKHIFTVHQILRKTQETCTTNMQNISPIWDLKERVALLNLTDALYMLLVSSTGGA